VIARGVLVPPEQCATLADLVRRAVEAEYRAGSAPIPHEVHRLLMELEAVAANVPLPPGVERAEEVGTSEAAEMLGLSTRQVRQLAAARKLDGARKVGNAWVIASPPRRAAASA
jgi:hypothetical protein